MPIDAVKRFLRMESSSGILLMAAAALALVLSNSPLDRVYAGLLDVRMSVSVSKYALDKPLLLWINDGLMAVFFLLIGLEIKREILEGELRSREQIVLPAAAAFGGFVLPALIYVWINRHDTLALNGWAIPAATDIAFALGVLMLLGKRVPLSLKLFLTSLAIFDDLAAILVIALFYSGALSMQAVAVAGAATIALVVMNRTGVMRIAAYALVGVVMWTGVLKSGVHATLAGIVVALAIPMRSPAGGSPLCSLEDSLHPWVAYLILPVFAFANAGVSFSGISMSSILGTVPLGILLGLFLGKQIGVFVMTWLTIRLGWAAMPAGSNWAALYGVATLTGIGFTMSLFIGTLAFEQGGFDYAAATRFGVLSGSLLSAMAGLAIVRIALARQSEGAD